MRGTSGVLVAGGGCLGFAIVAIATSAGECALMEAPEWSDPSMSVQACSRDVGTGVAGWGMIGECFPSSIVQEERPGLESHKKEGCD